MPEDTASDLPIVIVGGGLAAGTAVTELRERGYDGPITLFADEQHVPYERPPLSKAYLMGNDPAEKAFVHDAGWYAEHGVDVRTGTRVDAIDPERHVVTAGGEEVGYRGLLLATGATPRHLAMADESSADVHYLRTLDDSTRLRDAFGEGMRIGIVGAGWIGLEVAAAARLAGSTVTVWEMTDQPLQRVVGDEVGALFAQLHREHDVDLHLGVTIETIERSDGGNATVVEGDGTRTEVDALVVGVGVSPAVNLAEAAGLGVDDGVLVDAHLRTSAPDVYAAGDVANVDHPKLGRLRVEHWDTARKHGAVAAAGLLGEDAVADDLPYFFTDQYDLGLEYVGNPGPDGFDRIVITGDTEGPVEKRVFRVWWLRGDLVVAGMHVNDWDAIDRVRELVGTRITDDSALR